MNRAHRFADQVRNVVGWLNRVPVESQFETKGYLNPAEFVEAGDQLVFQCPSWQWQPCYNRKAQVFWLPPNKQYLLTRNIPCRHRVSEWEQSFCKKAQVTPEGWMVPGPKPEESTNEDLAASECTVRTPGGAEVSVRHRMDTSSDSSHSCSNDEGGRNCVTRETDEFVDVLAGECMRREEGFTVIGTDATYGDVRKKTDGEVTVPTRSYDLTITYDKYYQSPRLWLFGYDESGVPLRADAVFEDIHTDYLSKTVTVDPHPFTGVPTVSIHPCKHAAVLRSVAQNWLKYGVEPRHDLALFILLKMVSSVVPTINYDFTIDIEMPIGDESI